MEINLKDGTTTDPKIISDCFVNYFSGVGGSLASKIKTCNHMQPSYTEPLIHSIFLSCTDREEVIRIIKDLKPQKTPGHDEIRSDTIRLISEQIADPLVFLINKAIDTGVFPDILKKTVIVPVYKGDSRLDVVNYRPISLITNFAKILEKILKTRILSFLEKNNILSHRQYGFREGKSTEDAIVHLTKQVYKSINNSEPSVAVFVDLAKAFDTVDHVRLLHDLEQIGFRGVPYKLMRSYLEGRKQIVKIGGVYSQEKTIEYGVPQGTVIGPILFNIYLHDLYKLETTGDVISFADDTVIFFKDSTWQKLEQQVQGEMCKIFHFFKHKSLTVNFRKTCYVPFASFPKHLPEYAQIEIKDQCMNVIINGKTETKYLGIYIDSHLKWDVQVNYVVRKLRSLLHMTHVFSRHNLLMLYHTLVVPHLTYGIVAWGGVMNNFLDNLQRIQKWIIKVIFKKEITYSTDLLFDETSLFDLRQIFCNSLLVRQFKNKHELVKIDHCHETRFREGGSSKVPKVEKTLTQRGYYYLGPKIFNMLPPDIRNIQSESLYKSRIKKWIHSKNRYEIHSMIDMKNSYEGKH